MTMANVILKKQYPKEYTPATSTRVSNALLVGEIFGQVIIGLTCDYFGRKFAIIATTLMIGAFFTDGIFMIFLLNIASIWRCFGYGFLWSHDQWVRF